LSELAEKFGICSENFVCHAFDLFADFSGRFQLMNIGNDFPLLLVRELSDLLDNFICAHDANLPMFATARKLCGETTSTAGDLEHYAIFGVSFGDGFEGRAGVSVSG
jgi:hypothetical protein